MMRCVWHPNSWTLSFPSTGSKIKRFACGQQAHVEAGSGSLPCRARRRAFPIRSSVLHDLAWPRRTPMANRQPSVSHVNLICRLFRFYVKSRNSWLYYIFALLRDELRDVTLFHELLNKRGRNIRIRVGQPLSAAWLPRDPVEATEYLKRQVVSGLTDWQGLPPVPQRGRRKVAASPV